MEEPLVLGILGSGDVSDALIEAQMEDQIKSARNREVQIWVPSGLSSPALSTLLAWADSHDLKVLEVEDVVERAERVLVFWNNDLDTRQAVERALEQGLEVRDLCSVGSRISQLVPWVPPVSPNNYKEQKPVPKTYTEDELLEMEEGELVPIAESFGITNHADIETWEQVVALIMAQQADSTPEAEEAPSTPEAAPEASEEGEGAYTQEELETLPHETLKAICVENGWDTTEVGERPRSKRLVAFILEKQEEAGVEAPTKPAPEPNLVSISAEKVDDEEGPCPSIGKLTEVVHNELENSLAVAVASLTENIASANNLIATSLTRVADLLTEIKETLSQMTAAKPAPPTEEPKKATATKATAPVAKAGIRRVSRARP